MPELLFAKHLLKRGIKIGARTLAPLCAAPEPVARILTYHSTGTHSSEMNVTPDNFAAQMAWLARNRPVISLERAAAGEHGVAITFDDGYRDNLVHALPILERHGFPATIFVVAGCMGATLPAASEPDPAPIMTGDELRDVARRGFDVGGHSMTHRRLSTLSPEQQAEEIGGCKRQLERLLEAPVAAFAYPYGSALDYTSSTVERVKEAGFARACSNRYGYHAPGEDTMAMRRIWIDRTDTLRSFADKVTGRLDFLRLQDSACGIRARRWLNRSLGVE